MTNDSIERILDDATMSPKAYCHKHDCGQGIYDELADYVPDMCIHLVGRTEAVMRHADQEEQYRRGFDEGFASADDWIAQNEDEMSEHGWFRLPVDADGVPIRVGDDLVTEDGARFVVDYLCLYPWGFRVNGDGTDEDNFTCTVRTFPDVCRHYHEPEAEAAPDVGESEAARALRDWCSERYVDSSKEFSALYDISEAMDSELRKLRELADEYAARLRQREE